MAKVSGGDRLKAKLDKIKLNAKNRTLRVGFLENRDYPISGRPVPLVAAVQEYGAPGAQFPIPPRPFFRTMIAKNKANWPIQAAALLKQYNYDTDKVFQAMGNEIAGLLKQSIATTNAPALSQVTLMVRKMQIGSMQQPAGLGKVYEAVRRVKSGETVNVRKPGKRAPRGSVSGKPLIYTGLLQNSVDFDIK
jgi:hypothetical protein